MGRGWPALLVAVLACAPESVEQAGSAGTGAQGGDLIDRGGRIMPSSATVAVWWGPRAGFSADVIPAVETFLSGLRDSPLIGMTDQYMRGKQTLTAFAGSLFNQGTPPPDPHGPVVLAELCSFLHAQGRRPDGSAVYLVYSAVKSP